MILQYITTGVVAAAFLLQLAVNRAPDTKGSFDHRTARRLIIVGLFVVTCYLGWICAQGREEHAPVLLGVLLLGFGEILFCIDRLFPAIVPHAQVEHLVKRSAVPPGGHLQ